jgi:hypothetical protein
MRYSEPRILFDNDINIFSWRQPAKRMEIEREEERGGRGGTEK